MRIYVASSWRNERQPGVVERLRAEGHEVYDFRHEGFGWHQIDPEWKTWTAEQYMASLCDDLAEQGFARDFTAMVWAEAFVLVHPSGRSAHLEAGWAAGAGKPVYCLLEQGGEPELMVKLFTIAGGGVYVDLEEIVDDLAALQERRS